MGGGDGVDIALEVGPPVGEVPGLLFTGAAGGEGYRCCCYKWAVVGEEPGGTTAWCQRGKNSVRNRNLGEREEGERGVEVQPERGRLDGGIGCPWTVLRGRSSAIASPLKSRVRE